MRKIIPLTAFFFFATSLVAPTSSAQSIEFKEWLYQRGIELMQDRSDDWQQRRLAFEAAVLVNFDELVDPLISTLNLSDSDAFTFINENSRYLSSFEKPMEYLRKTNLARQSDSYICDLAYSLGSQNINPSELLAVVREVWRSVETPMGEVGIEERIEWVRYFYNVGRLQTKVVREPLEFFQQGITEPFSWIVFVASGLRSSEMND